MSKFKPGDLAITLIDLPPVMAGSVVELETKITKGDIVHTAAGPMLANGSGWIRIHELVPGKCAYGEGALMPLKGDFHPEQQKAKGVEA
ncbi:hypothetical protein I5102_003411 [Pseudomonas aeruginosa]|uniref:hypothetical protein n=1 Tax=Pseudomonas aeruginosa TaxID=287 RepID=UPI0018B03BF3|nr:hypothetical protein [Pseudomonas aeruginosa]QPP24920.1 hypothetical protein I5102_003411 [Pseudomonas aeruginosa]